MLSGLGTKILALDLNTDTSHLQHSVNMTDQCIHVVLSPKALARVCSTARSGDKVLYPRSFGGKSPFTAAELHYIDLYEAKHEDGTVFAAFADWLRCLSVSPSTHDLLFIHANAIGAYAFRPLLRCIDAIECVLRELPGRLAFHLPAGFEDAEVPVHLVHSLEQPRGSVAVLGAFIGRHVVTRFGGTPNTVYQYRHLGWRDLAATRGLFLRAALPFIAGSGACLDNIFVSAIGRSLRPVTATSTRVDSVAICRSSHQVRALQEHLVATQSCSSRVALLALPQLQAGINARVAVSRLYRGYLRLGVPLSDRLLSFASSVYRGRRAVTETACMDGSLVVQYGREAAPLMFRTADLVRGAAQCPQFSGLDLLLHRLARHWGEGQRILHFEVAGTRSLQIYLAAHQLGHTSEALQTVAVSKGPYVFFPTCHRFVCNTGSSYRSLLQASGEALGSIEKPIVTPDAIERRYPSSPTTITLFTQPYDFVGTALIAEALSDVASKLSATLLVRLHPRDRVTNYPQRARGLIQRHLAKAGVDLASLLSISDLAVVRTSSVAVDALRAGVPLVAVTLDDFERQFDVFWIQGCGEATPSRCDSVSELVELTLYHYPEVGRRSRLLWQAAR
jgi:hypothetical protein